MKYLLIDFGASFIKSIIFDSDKFVFTEYACRESPFIYEETLQINSLKNIITEIMNFYQDYDFVVTCSIKNGTYKNDVYYSWKILDVKNIEIDSCLISQIFKNQETYHVHLDHCKFSKEDQLDVLGSFNGKVFLSNLGDTDCVSRSIKLNDKEVLINLGTGSQIFFGNNIISFIPSGRALNVFYKFFSSLGKNIFDDMSNISLPDLYTSDLSFDLSVFEQAINFKDYGKIVNITEKNFTYQNFIQSLLKSYLNQYINLLKEYDLQRIYLTGGIALKIKIIEKYLEKELSAEVKYVSEEINSTHIGMANLIVKNEKNTNNWI